MDHWRCSVAAAHIALASFGGGWCGYLCFYLRLVDNLCSTPKPAGPPRDLAAIRPDKFSHRGYFGLNRKNVLKVAFDQLSGSIWAVRFAIRKPAPLAKTDKQSALPNKPQYSLIFTSSLSRVVTQSYRQAAKANGVKLNDQLVTDYFCAMVKMARSGGNGF